MPYAQIGILAERLNQASLDRSLDPNRIEQLKIKIIPTEHALAILKNCLQIVFFPYGAKAPANQAEFSKVVEQMTATLEDLKRNIAAHNITEIFEGRKALSQYNASAIFYGFGSLKIREIIAIEMRHIRLLISQSQNEEDKTGFTRINEVATKLAHAVTEATALLEENFTRLATALVETGS